MRPARRHRDTHTHTEPFSIITTHVLMGLKLLDGLTHVPEPNTMSTQSEQTHRTAVDPQVDPFLKRPKCIPLQLN